MNGYKMKLLPGYDGMAATMQNAGCEFHIERVNNRTTVVQITTPEGNYTKACLRGEERQVICKLIDAAWQDDYCQ
ncbi:MAG: hypothetical protein ACNA8H_11290 [Anaerolineales bacterium]